MMVQPLPFLLRLTLYLTNRKIQLMRAFSLIILLFSCSLSADSIDRFAQHVTYLSSDRLLGRGIDTAGIDLAANYIAGQFSALKLAPYSESTYFQIFYSEENGKEGKNVVGWIPAIEKTNDSIIFMAHYDGLGISRDADSSTDTIFNGARDNAAGVAALIELARLFKQEKAVSQNLVFIATTMEETNLGGSAFYVSNPLFPLDRISISLNIDGFNVSGLRKDFFIMPRQGITMVEDIVAVASGLSLEYNPPEWVDGMNTKFDSASFLSKGVPSVTLWPGETLKNGLAATQKAFGAIHSVDDEINASWDYSGVPEHLNLYKHVALYFTQHPEKAKVLNPALFIPD